MHIGTAKPSKMQQSNSTLIEAVEPIKPINVKDFKEIAKFNTKRNKRKYDSF